MNKALIVYSKHTKIYAEKIGKKYDKVDFLQVNNIPNSKILYYCVPNDFIVIGIGGGSVIDTAKIMANPDRCIAIPTTASGACATPYATIWGDKKESIKTAKPILKFKKDIEIDLPYKVENDTFFDAYSHAIESLYSKNATLLSKYYSKKALKLLKKYQKNYNIYTLIKAGNYAGKAIAITKTNVVHAISYPLTLQYGISHGLACGLVLPYVFPYYYNLSKLYPYYLVDLKQIDSNLIAELAIKYKKITESLITINKNFIINILERIKEEHYVK